MKKLLILMCSLLLLFSCGSKKGELAKSEVQYTCPMHPQVVKDEMDECPICHMDLVPVNNVVTDTAAHQNMHVNTTAAEQDMSNMSMHMPNEIELTDEQIQLANIVTDTFGSSNITGEHVLTGTIVLNEKGIETVSARVKGRIERLYFKNRGDYVAKGAPLYSLYSEELNSAKQEYVLLLKQKSSIGNADIDYSQLVDAARHKLKLWGMTASQIRGLEKRGQLSYTTTFYSTASGFIKELNVIEGAYVMEGGSVVRLANMATVWVEAQVYATQLSKISRNASVTVRLPQLGNKEVKGKIEFASPEINAQSRINLLRVNIPNEGNSLKPGMVAYIYLKNSAEAENFSLPIDAVIRSGTQAHVWLKGFNNTFKMQKIVTGVENGGIVAITSGLKAGDVVVVSGAYLLNSEYLLRNGLSTMEGMEM